MAHGLILLAIAAAALVIGWLAVRLGIQRRQRAQLTTDAAVAHERASRTRADAFTSLGTSIAEGADPSATLRLAVDAVPRLFGASGCVITLPQADGRLRHVVWSGLPESDSAMHEYSFAPGEGYIGRAFAEGRAIRVDDVLNDSTSHGAAQDARTGTRAFVVAPLAAHGRILGCIGATRNTPFGFTIQDEETLTAVGRQVAVALAAAQSREAARLEAAQKSAILEQMADAVLVTDIQARIVLANPAASDLYGLSSPRDLIDLRPVQWQWQTLDDRGVPLIQSERPVLRALRGQPTNAEHCIIGVDGVERWASIACTPLRNDDGHLQGAILVAHNITERRHAELALRTSEERFRALIAHNSDLIIILEADGIFRYVSPSVESLLGYAAEELLGLRGALVIANLDDLPAMQQVMQ
jgi:PAS domain S-box-containing protein